MNGVAEAPMGPAGVEKPTVPPGTTAARAHRDQALFERVALEYCRKDMTPASRHARRHRLLRSFAALPGLERPRVLEAGCGGGFSATYLRGRFARYLGIDYSERLIAFARQENAGAAVEFVVADITDYAPPEPVDVVFMIGVLHHLPDPAAAVRHMRDWLRPGGWFLANEPQPGNPVVQLARWVRKRVDRTYSAEQEELSRRELEQVLRTAGLEAIQITPQGLFSTPLAEIVLPLRTAALGLARVACGLDTLLERLLRPLLYRVSWNLIAIGRRPGAAL